ncbi:hypothetical protein FNV43_RR21114 [Rhamnella rubrinervis]|uniref:CBS domain-containing protein n=1 Tax=Rhamnella rubrinervis TaxID=2594499 RepID=A0A8K0E7T7_9ROSA|nr:hypothetical protein FNV43_RR21114 [Rhamnella rubrinervis]
MDNIHDLQVKDVMKKQDELPVCREGDLIMDQLVELTIKGCGCLLVIDEECHLIGTFTDGDLRCTLKASEGGIFKLTVGEMCNSLSAKHLSSGFSLNTTYLISSEFVQPLALSRMCLDRFSLLDEIWVQMFDDRSSHQFLHLQTLFAFTS